MGVNVEAGLGIRTWATDYELRAGPAKICIRPEDGQVSSAWGSQKKGHQPNYGRDDLDGCQGKPSEGHSAIEECAPSLGHRCAAPRVAS
eukprot:3312024-Alexandrium_andersonii.AAC.1